MNFTGDPRILLGPHISPAIGNVRSAVISAFRSEETAEARAIGLGIPYERAFCLLAAIRAVELYKQSGDRKHEKSQHRQSQRNAKRRLARPLTRSPRRLDEWEGSPSIPASGADALALAPAHEWLSLILVGFSENEETQPHKRVPLLLIGDVLPHLSKRHRTLHQARENLRKTIKRPFKHPPSSVIRRFHGFSSQVEISELAASVFEHWIKCVFAEQTDSGRPKSKLIRAY